MSEHRLPENLEQWPHDPFALLGVNHASSRRDVRRAYARLIRNYKPEHAPEEFRRIRDAYEILDRQLAWMEADSDGTDEAEPDETGPDVMGPAADAEPAPEAEPAAETEPFLDADLLSEIVPVAGLAADAMGDAADAEILGGGDGQPATTGTWCPGPVLIAPAYCEDPWQEARRGDLAAAYANAAYQVQKGGDDEELYVRLFWLLRMAPELDPARDPRDWLLAGMKRCGLRGRLPELYRCELLEDPLEALRERCEAAIHCPGRLGLLAELIMARWVGAAKLEKWEVIRRDLGPLRGRVLDEPSLWGRLLLAAIDLLAWSKEELARQTLTACRKEVEHVAEQFQPLAAELNQRDHLFELVQACDKLESIAALPADWRKSLRWLLARSWNQPFESCRQQLIQVLAPLVKNPIAGLEWLDRLTVYCGPALNQLGVLVNMLAREGGVGLKVPPSEVLRDRLVEFLYAVSKRRYSERWLRWIPDQQNYDRSGRIELLMFCLQESVSMKQVTSVLAGYRRDDLAKFLTPASSPPLHLMCLAYQAFWA